ELTAMQACFVSHEGVLPREARSAGQDRVEGGEDAVRCLAIRFRANQADAPDRRRRRTEATTHLQVELPQEAHLDFLAVDACGHAHSRQLDELVPRLGEEF